VTGGNEKMGYVCLSLDKAYLMKTMAEAEKTATKDGAKGKLTWFFNPDLVTEVEKSNIVLHTGVDNKDCPIGYIYICEEPNMDTQIDLVELIVKKLNKFKAMLESLKD
jgi:hypothetical protein